MHHNTLPTLSLAAGLSIATMPASAQLEVDEIKVEGDSLQTLKVNGVAIGQQYSDSDNKPSYTLEKPLKHACSSVISTRVRDLAMNDSERKTVREHTRKMEDLATKHSIRQYRYRAGNSGETDYAAITTSSDGTVISVNFKKNYNRSSDDILNAVSSKYGVPRAHLNSNLVPTRIAHSTPLAALEPNNKLHDTFEGLHSDYYPFIKQIVNGTPPADALDEYALINVSGSTTYTTMTIESIGNLDQSIADIQEYLNQCKTSIEPIAAKIEERLDTKVTL